MTTRLTAKGRVRIALGLALVMTATACASSGAKNPGNGAGATKAAVQFAPSGPLHGNQLLYGVSATRDDSITYQPDVVFLAGGADSIKAVSADGMQWTVSGSAANVAAMQPGKIMVATNYGVGRVLAVNDAGADKVIALGPVGLTDIVKDGTFASSSPVAISGVYAYDTSGQPGLVADGPVEQSRAGAVTLPEAHFLAYTSARPRQSARPAVRLASNLPAASSSIPSNSSVGGFNVQTVCCTDVGLHIGYDKGGGRVSATVGLQLSKPSVGFHISIGGSKVVDAGVSLSGTAGIKFDISAATMNSAGNFKGPRVEVPVDIQIPIAAGPIPMTIGFQQVFSMGLALSGQASFSAQGEYTLGGALGFSVDRGGPHVSKPTFGVKKSIIESMKTLSVGPSGLDLAYALKLSIGVGTIGLTAGAWYQVTASLGLTSSGTPGTALVTCKRAELTLKGKYGVGYSIPNIVAQAINFFLRAIFTNPRPVLPSGGPEWGPSDIIEPEKTPACSK
jgi:hypothetical protein